MSQAANTDCPSDGRLGDWLEGRITGTEWNELTSHIDSCDRCQSALEQLNDATDGVAAELRLGRRQSPADEPTRLFQSSEEPTDPTEAPSSSTEGENDALVGTVLGQYRIEEIIGRGGMGAVYRATHLSLQKTVALKVLPAKALSAPEAVERFQREMRAIGAVDHSNIVGAHDAGEIDGVHYLVMEYVDGQDLASFVREHGPLSPRSACRLIRQAAVGLQHAHTCGLVHRDVKPSNLIMTTGPGPKVVKVLDLGLARIQNPHAEPGTVELTSTGQVMGTVDYMAPEQAINIREADEQSDIYSLGMTLFFLLTGRPAFERETPMQRLLAHREDPLPSLSEIRRSIPDCVQHLFERMADKDKSARPASMNELLTLLDDCLVQIQSSRQVEVDEASSPQPTDSETQTQLTIDQSSSGATLVNAAAVESAEAGRDEDHQTGRRWLKPVVGVALLAGLTVGLLPMLQQPQSRTTPVDSEFGENRSKDESAATVGAAGSSSDSVELSGLTLEPGPATNALRGLVALPATLDGVGRWQIETAAPRAGVSSVAFSPDDELIALATTEDYVRLVDSQTLELRGLCRVWPKDVHTVCWSPDSQFVAVGCGKGVVRIWDRNGTPTQTIQTDSRSLVAVDWSPDGNHIAVIGDDGVLRLFTPAGESGAEIQTSASVIRCIAWRPGSTELAVSTHDQKYFIVDTADQKEQAIADGYGQSIDWTSDGSRLALPRGDSVGVWSAETGVKQVALRPHTGVGRVAWNNDGQFLVVSSNTSFSRIISADGEEICQLSKGPQTVCDWSHDGKTIVTADMHCSVQLWDSAGRLITSQQADGGHIRALAWSRDGSTFVVGGEGTENSRAAAGVWSADGKQTATFLEHKSDVDSISWHPDGKLIATADNESVKVWSPDGKLHILIDGRSPVAWNPNGNVLATFKRWAGSEVRIWGVDGKLIETVPDVLPGSNLTWSPDGSRLAFAGPSKRISVWQSDTKERVELPQLPMNGPHFRNILWSPVSDWILATVHGTNHAFLMSADGSSGPDVSEGSYADGAAWSPDGTQLAIGDGGETQIRLWSVEGQQRGRLTRGLPRVEVVAWGHRNLLVAGNTRREIRVWDTETRMPVWTAVLLPEGRSISFSASGQIIATKDADTERELVCLVERDDGGLDVLKPSEFEARTGIRLQPVVAGN